MQQTSVSQDMRLNDGQAAAYKRDGYLFPIDIYSESEAADLRRQLEEIEDVVKDNPDQSRAVQKRPAWVLPFIDRIVRDPRIVGAVASVLGPNVLVYNAAFFIKEPHTPNFVSWHQDLHYWGFNKLDEVTAWLALSPATTASGCMQFVPGSHERDVEHRDTFSADNMLTRGQELAVEVDPGDTVDVELKPGQISLHHGRMFHSSGPNHSADRRIGLAIRYITPEMCQVGGERLGATLACGEDTHGHYEHVPAPKGILNQEDMERYRRLMALDHSIKFRGAAQDTERSMAAAAGA